MSLEEKIKQEQLQLLTDMWKNAKDSENKFKEERLRIEEEAVAFLKDKLPTKGTYTAETNLQLTPSEEEKWNQEKVAELKEKFDDGQLNEIPFFPFDITYKPNSNKIKLLREVDEKLYFKIFGDALTTKPKKVSFKMKK